MRNHKVEQSVAEPGAIPAAGEGKKLGKRVNGASQRANSSSPSLSIYNFLLLSLFFFLLKPRENHTGMYWARGFGNYLQLDSTFPF